MFEHYKEEIETLAKHWGKYPKNKAEKIFKCSALDDSQKMILKGGTASCPLKPNSARSK